MPTRLLAGRKLSPIGLGCMNLSHAYGAPPPEDEAAGLLLRALDLGVDFFDTAALYGFGSNEALLGRVLAPHRQRIFLASKCGMQGVDGKRVIDGRPATLKATCEDSLRRLQTDHIDLYYLHRWDKQVPIEDSVGALAELVRDGKIGAIGLSEVSAATLRRAHAVHPIAAVQSEYSLWTRNPELGVLATCRELGAAFVAFSPLGRGFLTDMPPDYNTLDAKDIRRGMPRFEPAHQARNLRLLDSLRELARAAHTTPARLALAWLLARDPCLLAIPGTTSIAHLEDNLGAATLRPAADLLATLDELFAPGAISGSRYNAATQAEIDTEEF